MKMRLPPRLPGGVGVKMTQGFVLLEMSKGAVITVEHVNEPPSSVRKVYRLSSNNCIVRGDLFGTLLANELIKPNSDGLPGFGESQTYSFRRSTDIVPDDGQ